MRKPYAQPRLEMHDTSDHLFYRLLVVHRRRGWGWRQRSPHRHRKAGRA